MCDDETLRRIKQAPRITRRSFAAITASAAAIAGTSAFGQSRVSEKDVSVTTPDGVSDAVLFHPDGAGSWPGVIIWADIMGLRPVFREMGRRLASQGYTVLVPNPFYRSATAAAIVAAGYNFGQPEGRTKLVGMRGAMSDVEGDARAYVAFLDAQPQTAKGRKVGVQGYCMGGPLSFQTAGAVPGRIGAVASFHGGGLVTSAPASPHLLIASTRAEYLVAVAQNDDASDPQAKTVLRQTFAETGRPATVEVYPANHGWCVPGAGAYDAAQAEKAWSELLAMYRRALV